MAGLTVHLPDGSALPFEPGVSLTTVAEAIGPGLAKAALAAKVDGETCDLSTTLDHDAEVVFLTWRDDEGKLVYRHSTAHIMAQAVQRLFPEAKVTIGPALEDGRFYYDFDVEKPFTPEDLRAIEEEMARVIRENQSFRRAEVSVDEAKELFATEPYKLEMIGELADQGQTLSVYFNDRDGEPAWYDLCRGPAHVPATGKIGEVKLLASSGAYWRGDSNNKMLQRIYGTAFPDRKQLKAYLELREQAEARDHRKLGRELDLVWFNDVAPACPFFFPKGAFIYNRLVDMMRSLYRKYGYEEVITPQILDVEMWHKSGHWDAYRENMYFVELDGRTHAVKPMNCPSHAIMFGSRLHSYRDLPVRYADFGRLHRYEASGVTAGLTRVRSFAQDDAHIFCTEEQVEGEVNAFIDMLLEVYHLFVFEDVKIDLSTRPEKSVGSDEMWSLATRLLDEALTRRGVEFHVAEGEGAFYGPKIDFMVSDALQRRHQLGTCQLDFQMPERFGLEYVTADDGRAQPVMVHRAVLGSIERFMGILIEHTGGNFPVWLAPLQVVVIPISDEHRKYAEAVAAKLRAAGHRVEVDTGQDRMQAKIAVAETQHVPYMLVCGDREAESGQVAVRGRGRKNLGSERIESFLERIGSEGVFPPL